MSNEIERPVLGTQRFTPSPTVEHMFGVAHDAMEDLRNQGGPIGFPQLDKAAEAGLTAAGFVAGSDLAVRAKLFEWTEADWKTLLKDALPFAKVWDLMAINRLPDGNIELTPQMMSTDVLFQHCFPHENERWLKQMGACCEDVMHAIANVAQNVREVSAPVGALVPIAEITGSMARSLFRNEPPSKLEASSTLATLRQNHPGSLSRLLQLALDNDTVTGIYDMDIVLTQPISPDAVIGALKEAGANTTSETNGDMTITMPNGTKGMIRRLELDYKTVVRLILSTLEGPSFSIDLAPKSDSEEAVRADFRAAPHEPNKRTQSTLDIVMSANERDVTQVGVSGEPTQVVDSLIQAWMPSRIPDPEYISFIQALHAGLSIGRIEQFTPASALFDIRIEQNSLEGILREVVMHAFAEGPLLRKVPEARRSETVREGMVLLCADNQSAVRFLRNAGFDIFFGIVEELRDIERYSPDEFRTNISTDPHFANEIAQLFDLWGKNYPTQDKPISPPLLTPERHFALMQEAVAFAQQHAVELGHTNPNGLSVLRSPYYTTWVLQSPNTQYIEPPTNGQQYDRLQSALEDCNLVGQICLLNVGGSTQIDRIGACTPDGGLSMQGLYDLILSSRCSPDIVRARGEIYDIYLADLMLASHAARGDTFYPLRTASLPDRSQSDRLVGFPPAIARVVRSRTDGSSFTTITCPLMLSPRLALKKLQRSIQEGKYGKRGK